jgi:hypothetical protein
LLVAGRLICIGCAVDDWHPIGRWFDGCSRRKIVLWDVAGWLICIGCAVDDWHAIGRWFDGCSRRNIVLWDCVV